MKPSYEELEQQLAESHRALRAETTAHDNLKMQLEKMAAENVGLKESRQRLAEFIHEELDADYPLNMDIEIPSTDSFLAEVRAQGVEMFGQYHNFSEKLFIQKEAQKFAENLRKGVQS